MNREMRLEDYLDPEGNIAIPAGVTLTSFLERNVAAFGDTPAYRYLDFDHDRTVELTWSQMGPRLRAVSARLQQITQPGDRVAILAPQGVDYVIGFFAAIQAGAIAVPLFAPELPGHTERLDAVLGDAEPTVVLTTTSAAGSVGDFLRTLPRHRRPRMLAIDALPDSVGAAFTPTRLDTDAIAYLQYTSGSTRIPTGVQITHLNLATNVVQVIEALDGQEGDRGVSWLPFFHDMGLITVLLSPMLGHYITFMTPAAFVRRPGRWIREMARKESDTGGTISVAPNFAFDHAAVRGVPKDGEPPLDMSNIKCILNGSEPISAATVNRFNEAFGPFGFKPQAIKPSYGLAEATLFVSTTPMNAEPRIIHVDRDELNRHRFVEVPADSPKAVAQAGAGQIGVAEWAVIVDNDSATELPDGQIGEVWISGQNMGTGYWGKPEETVATFQNTLKSRTNPSHAEGATDDATWVRTGDLGAYHDGELYITGRTKDLVIIDGRNHYPQDLEYSAQESTKALRTGFVAAFSVPANQLPDDVFEDAHAGLKRDPDDTSEQLVIVGERAPGAHKLEMGPIADDIRAAIAVRHGVTVRDVLLTPAGAIPRTSSGKIGRRACRSAYLDGSLRSGKVANAFPDETD